MDPTLRQFEKAIEAAGDAGDLEAVRELGRAMRVRMQRQNPSLGMPEKVRLGAESMPDSIRSVVREQSRPAQVYAGAGGALALAAHGVNDLFRPEGKTGEWNSLDNAEVANWRALNAASGDTIGGNLLGNALLFGALPARTGLMPGRLGMVADTGLTSGGINYATTPGGSADRSRDALLGAVTALPVPALYALGSGTRQAITRGGKQVAVGEGLLTESGGKADDLISQLQAPPTSTIGSFSAGMKTQDPMLQVMESGSRAKRGDLWKPFDRENAKARWDALVSRAGTKEELEALESVVNAKTGELRAQALTDAQLTNIFSQSGDIRPEMMRPLEKLVSDWRFNLRPSKGAQTLANYIDNEIKQGLTPDQLYVMRKELVDGIQPGRNDELSNAVKTARKQSVDAIKVIDDTLDTLSGGGWREYLKTHAKGMKPVESKRALQDIVGSLERGMPAGIVPPAMGESPAWKTVGTLRDRFGTKEMGKKEIDTLLPEDRELVDAIVDSLKRQADTMGAGKATLGSPTAPLLANMGRADAVTRNVVENGINRVLPGGDILASKVFDKLGRQAEEELARLLQDPNALADAIARAIQSRRMREGASRLGGASAGAYTSNQ